MSHNPKLALHCWRTWLLGLAMVGSCAASQAAENDVSAPLTLAPASARAVWVNAGYYSLHIDNQPGLRDANIGLGMEVRLDDTWAATAGRFMNSDSVHSHYLGAYYRPWRVAGGQVGVMGGLINGYPNAFNGGWFPALAPVATWERDMVGLNVIFVPPIQNRLYGAISFQLKLRVY